MPRTADQLLAMATHIKAKKEEKARSNAKREASTSQPATSQPPSDAFSTINPQPPALEGGVPALALPVPSPFDAIHHASERRVQQRMTPRKGGGGGDTPAAGGGRDLSHSMLDQLRKEFNQGSVGGSDKENHENQSYDDGGGDGGDANLNLEDLLSSRIQLSHRSTNNTPFTQARQLNPPASLGAPSPAATTREAATAWKEVEIFRSKLHESDNNLRELTISYERDRIRRECIEQELQGRKVELAAYKAAAASQAEELARELESRSKAATVKEARLERELESVSEAKGEVERRYSILELEFHRQQVSSEWLSHKEDQVCALKQEIRDQEDRRATLEAQVSSVTAQMAREVTAANEKTGHVERGWA
jgi:hypothetical protein